MNYNILIHFLVISSVFYYNLWPSLEAKGVPLSVIALISVIIMGVLFAISAVTACLTDGIFEWIKDKKEARNIAKISKETEFKTWIKSCRK